MPTKRKCFFHFLVMMLQNVTGKEQGPVVREPISANLSLNAAQGLRFSCLKESPLLISRDNLNAANVKLLSENNLLESTWLWI